jgi:hypothetical protein
MSCFATVSRTQWPLLYHVVQAVHKEAHIDRNHPHSTEHYTQPIAYIISKQAVPYRTRAARALSLRLRFEGLRPLFMGRLVPDRSREKVLAILSLIELNPALVGEKSRRG